MQDYSNLLRGLIFSSDNPLGFHSEIRSVLPIICTLAEILNNFKYHDPHNDFYLQIKLNQINLILLFCLDLLFIQLLLLIFATILSKSALFMNPATSDLSSRSLLFMLLTTIFVVNLL